MQRRAEHELHRGKAGQSRKVAWREQRLEVGARQVGGGNPESGRAWDCWAFSWGLCRS